MILKSAILVSALYMLTYCMKSNHWEILHCRVIGLQMRNPITSGFSLSIFLRSSILFHNSNPLGSHILKAKYDIYAAIEGPTGSPITPRVGSVELNDVFLFGSTSGPTEVSIDVTIEDLNMLLFLRLLNSLWDNSGVIKVIALGHAFVKSDMNMTSTYDPLITVAMKCTESVQINFSYNDLATLQSNPSKTCQFSYLSSSYSSDYFPTRSLPAIDAKYLYQNL